MIIKWIAAIAAAGMCSAHAAPVHQVLSSPDGHIRVAVYASAQKTPAYSIYRDEQVVIRDGDLGLELEEADLSRAMLLMSAAPVKRVAEHYEMAVGKRRSIDYVAKEQRFTFAARKSVRWMSCSASRTTAWHSAMSSP